MAYDQKRAFAAFKIARELDPTVMPIAFDELPDFTKRDLYKDHDNLHNKLVRIKITNLMEEAKKLAMTLIPEVEIVP